MRKNEGTIGEPKLFFLILLLCGVIIPKGATSAFAQSYPTKGIQLIVPFQPGGSSDLTGRMIAMYLSEKWGQTISVINKPGAGGIAGVTFALQAKNDGYANEGDVAPIYPLRIMDRGRCLIT